MPGPADQRVSSPQVCRCAGFTQLAGLETTAPESFAEPATLGWPAAPEGNMP
jgi:hypothetical protein